LDVEQFEEFLDRFAGLVVEKTHSARFVKVGPSPEGPFAGL
jgi:hypothetical protein